MKDHTTIYYSKSNLPLSRQITISELPGTVDGREQKLNKSLLCKLNVFI